MLEKTKKSLASLVLAGAVTLTALKDNVHFAFGSVNIKNPKENQYVWGVMPFVRVEGEAKGIYNFGIVPLTYVSDNSTINEGMRSYGLLFGGGILCEKGVKINGTCHSIGIISETPTGVSFGSRKDVNLENYVVE